MHHLKNLSVISSYKNHLFCPKKNYINVFTNKFNKKGGNFVPSIRFNVWNLLCHFFTFHPNPNKDKSRLSNFFCALSLNRLSNTPTAKMSFKLNENNESLGCRRNCDVLMMCSSYGIFFYRLHVRQTQNDNFSCRYACTFVVVYTIWINSFIKKTKKLSKEHVRNPSLH